MAETDHRLEHDSMGAVAVPTAALWGAQTERARQNFALSGLTLPAPFIAALGLVKWAAARANVALGGLDARTAAAIERAALAVAAGEHAAAFPLDDHTVATHAEPFPVGCMLADPPESQKKHKHFQH